MDITKNKLYKDIEVAKAIVRAVFQGREVGCILCGPPGVGKTFIAEEIGKTMKAKWRIVQPRSLAYFYDILYKYRFGGTLVWDDTDNVWNSEPMVNALKKVLQSSEKRFVSDDTKTGRGVFQVSTGNVFLTNKNLGEPELLDFDPKMRDHVAAIRSRLAYQIKAFSFDADDVYEYSVWLAVEGGMLKRAGLSLEESNDVLQFFAQNATRVPELSPRGLHLLGQLRKKHPDMWRAHAEGNMSDVPIREFRRPQESHYIELNGHATPPRVSFGQSKAKAKTTGKPAKPNKPGGFRL